MLSTKLIKTTSSLFNKSKSLFSQNSRNILLTSRHLNMVSFIGTHDGTFHCDDVTACFMLKQLTRFKNHDIVRTRNPEKLAEADIVVDVGGELDLEKLRLDHHQRGFNQTIKDYHPNIKTTNPDKAVRLSSSGLVYAIFGKDLITELLELGTSYNDLKDEDKKLVDAVFCKAYVEFFEEIDGIDNGVEVASGDNLVYNYYIGSGISSRVGRTNPLQWDASPELRLEHFKKGMELVGSELTEMIQFLGKIWWPQRQKFRELVLKRKEFDPHGAMVYSPAGEQNLGWKSAFFELEEELGIVGELKYIVYQDCSGTPNWRATCLPINPKSYTCRVPLKEEWRGKRDEDLQKTSGISDAVFVHMSGFTCGAKSKEGLLSMIYQSLGLKYDKE